MSTTQGAESAVNPALPATGGVTGTMATTNAVARTGSKSFVTAAGDSGYYDLFINDIIDVQQDVSAYAKIESGGEDGSTYALFGLSNADQSRYIYILGTGNGTIVCNAKLTSGSSTNLNTVGTGVNLTNSFNLRFYIAYSGGNLLLAIQRPNGNWIDFTGADSGTFTYFALTATDPATLFDRLWMEGHHNVAAKFVWFDDIVYTSSAPAVTIPTFSTTAMTFINASTIRVYGNSNGATISATDYTKVTVKSAGSAVTHTVSALATVLNNTTLFSADISLTTPNAAIPAAFDVTVTLAAGVVTNSAGTALATSPFTITSTLAVANLTTYLSLTALSGGAFYVNSSLQNSTLLSPYDGVAGVSTQVVNSTTGTPVYVIESGDTIQIQVLYNSVLVGQTDPLSFFFVTGRTNALGTQITIDFSATTVDLSDGGLFHLFINGVFADVITTVRDSPADNPFSLTKRVFLSTIITKFDVLEMQILPTAIYVDEVYNDLIVFPILNMVGQAERNRGRGRIRA